MIGKLTGIIDSLKEESLILNVNGVGYLIYTPTTLLSNLKTGSEISFFIEFQVREDSITLFGFILEDDKKLFTLLKTVQGVGAKLALCIMSLGFSEILNAILLQDIKKLQSVSGVGAKVANRIISELKDKVRKVFNKDSSINSLEDITNNENIHLLNEAMVALKSLGYSDKEAQTAINCVTNNKNNNFSNSLESIIKEALRYFSNKNNS